jgi:hypothetical protein
MILDPFMGGGTTVLEAIALGRRAVGCDINALATFVAGVKTTALRGADRKALTEWADETVPSLSYRDELVGSAALHGDSNLNLPLARPIRKLSALALETLGQLPSEAARAFARCALLNVAQLALNGRRTQLPLESFRKGLKRTLHDMLTAEKGLASSLRLLGTRRRSPVLINASAADLAEQQPFASGKLADVVVTSPPYPGIHVLYHRWQVDGRRESAAPYWIANCADGQGAVHYNFADRKAIDLYFERAAKCFLAIRHVMKPGSPLVQLVAFGSHREQLPRYLAMLKEAGFAEHRSWMPLWRRVPGRRWHAIQKSTSPASREILLVHRAV